MMTILRLVGRLEKECRLVGLPKMYGTGQGMTMFKSVWELLTVRWSKDKNRTVTVGGGGDRGKYNV